MEKSEQTGLVTQFVAITQTDSERARHFLEASAWRLDIALSTFFETGGASPEIREEVQSEEEFESDDEPEEIASLPQSSKTNLTQKNMSNKKFGTLGSLGSGNDERRDSGSSSDGEKDARQSYFVGGSENSGQTVLGPKKDDAKKLFEQARQHGAEVVSPTDSGASSSKKRKAFVGKGRRLGCDSDSATAEDPDDIEIIDREVADDFVPVTFRIYDNGFTLDDGDLRSFDQPANADFLSSIRQGRIPMELVRKYGGRQVDLRMENHQGETYKPSLKPFAGQGKRLGAVVPGDSSSCSAARPTTTPMKPVATSGPGKIAVKPFNDKDEKTQVQVRLANNQRLIVDTNLNSTVAQIRQAIISAYEEYAMQPFELLTTFPKKVINDESLTVASANLKNAVIIQKLLHE